MVVPQYGRHIAAGSMLGRGRHFHITEPWSPALRSAHSLRHRLCLRRHRRRCAGTGRRLRRRRGIGTTVDHKQGGLRESG